MTREAWARMEAEDFGEGARNYIVSPDNQPELAEWAYHDARLAAHFAGIVLAEQEAQRVKSIGEQYLLQQARGMQNIFSDAR